MLWHSDDQWTGDRLGCAHGRRWRLGAAPAAATALPLWRRERGGGGRRALRLRVDEGDRSGSDLALGVPQDRRSSRLAVRAGAILQPLGLAAPSRQGSLACG